MLKKLTLFLLLYSGICFAQDNTFEVKTGYGYFKDDKKHITDKSELPKGIYPLKEGYTYYEVSSRETLNAIQVYIKPKDEKQIIQELIDIEQKEILRNQAIDNLKSKGILDDNGDLKNS